VNRSSITKCARTYELDVVGLEMVVPNCEMDWEVNDWIKEGRNGRRTNSVADLSITNSVILVLARGSGHDNPMWSCADKHRARTLSLSLHHIDHILLKRRDSCFLEL
jgi:hypothetical protein